MYAFFMHINLMNEKSCVLKECFAIFWLILLILQFVVVAPVVAEIAPVVAETSSSSMTTTASVAPAADPEMRPDPEGVATKVSVGIYVYDLGKISDVDTTFTVDFFMMLKWRDPRLASVLQERPIRHRMFKIDEVWDPHVTIINERNLSRRLRDTVKVDQEGNVIYFQRYQGTLSFDLALREFPFDAHVLPIEMAAVGYGPEEVEFLVWEEKTGRGVTLSIVDWEIGPGAARVTPVYVPPAGRKLAFYHYELPAKRYTAFYIWKVIVPLSMIVFMSFAVFWIDLTQIGPRMSIAAASVLTIIFFQFHLGKLVPWVPYFTRVDYFSLGSMLLVFLALAQAVSGNALIRWGCESLALNIQWWSRLLFPASFVALIIIAFLI